jgi:WD40 repeat protein
MHRRRLLLIGIVAAAVAATAIAAFALGVFAPIHFREKAAIQLDRRATYSLAWSPDSSTLAATGNGKLWLISIEHIDAAPRLITEDLYDFEEVIYSPDGTLLALLGRGGIQLHAMPSGDIVTTLAADGSSIRGIVFSPDGARIASADLLAVRIYDAVSADLMLTIDPPHQVLDVAYSPDGSTLATVDCPGAYPDCGTTAILLWDALTGEQTGTLELPRLPGAYELAPVSDVVFSPDGMQLAGYGSFEVLEIWDWRAQDLRHDLLPRRDRSFTGFDDVEFTADGRFVAAASLDYPAEVWDVRSGKFVARVKGSAERGRTLAFSPDGALLAVIGEEGVLRLWHVLP